MKKDGIDFFGMGKSNKPASGGSTPRPPSRDDDQWEVWPETEFEDAARQELQDEMNEIELLSQEAEGRSNIGVGIERHAHGKAIIPNPVPSNMENASTVEEELFWSCPICSRPQPADDKAFNEHIDLCLSRQTIQDVVKATSTDEIIPEMKRNNSIPEKSSSKKRGRPTKDAEIDRAQKKLFFS